MTGDKKCSGDGCKDIHIHVPEMQGVIDHLIDLTNEQDCVNKKVKHLQEHLGTIDGSTLIEHSCMEKRLDQIHRRQGPTQFFVHFYAVLVFAFIGWLNWGVLSTKTQELYHFFVTLSN